jgi:hypothetical protein
VASDAFFSFFEKTSKIVERAMHLPYDPLVDYAAAVDVDRCVGERTVLSAIPG